MIYSEVMTLVIYLISMGLLKTYFGKRRARCRHRANGLLTVNVSSW
jgi:hypothetical protein